MEILMFNVKPKQLTILLSSIMVTACTSNGGSFELDSVKAESASAQSTKPTYTDVGGTRRTVTEEEANALQQPSLGAEVKIPFRNGHPRANAEAVFINESDIVNTNYLVSTLPHNTELEESLNEDNRVIHSNDKDRLNRIQDYQFVRAGFIAHMEPISEKMVHRPEPKHFEKHHGYVYYIGENTAKAMPTFTATYNGHWEYVTNAQDRAQRIAGKTEDELIRTSLGNAGTHYGATSLNLEDLNTENENYKVGNSAQFAVDFTNKKMTGAFNSNGVVAAGRQTIKKRYAVEAEIKGNRFVGKAYAEDKKHPYFGADSDFLEGGFYGDKAQELAGKFLANDKSIFVVFAAKRDVKEGDAEQMIDSVKISLSDLAKADMDNFGRATHLVINGVQVPLIADGKTRFSDMEFNEQVTRTINDKTYQITVCCNNLDYVKFGSYKLNGSEGHQYLVGERTPVVNLPKGKTHYRGTWDGVIYAKGGQVGGDSPSNKPSGTRSLFDVDFGEKRIEGKLIADNGFEERPMLTLQGNILGNGFTGTAKTQEKGFNLDPLSTNGGTVVHLDATFNGGFYGTQADELGGIVHSAEAGKDQVSIAFGGKRQVVK